MLCEVQWQGRHFICLLCLSIKLLHMVILAYITFWLGSNQTCCVLQNVTATEDNGKKPYSCWGFFTGRLPQHPMT